MAAPSSRWALALAVAALISPVGPLRAQELATLAEGLVIVRRSPAVPKITPAEKRAERK